MSPALQGGLLATGPGNSHALIKGERGDRAHAVCTDEEKHRWHGEQVVTYKPGREVHQKPALAGSLILRIQPRTEKTDPCCLSHRFPVSLRQPEPTKAAEEQWLMQRETRDGQKEGGVGAPRV